MIVVPVKEGENIEKALKKFKRKFEKTLRGRRRARRTRGCTLQGTGGGYPPRLHNQGAAPGRHRHSAQRARCPRFRFPGAAAHGSVEP